MGMRRRRGAELAMVAALAAVLTACAGAPAPPGGDAPTGDGVINVVDDAAQADLVLYVSNQSFEHDVVGVVVEIDGVPVVDQGFAVEGQHNWVEFAIDLPPGAHVLTATSSTGVTADEDLPIPEGEQRWFVVDYWYYPDNGDGSDVVDPSFTFLLSEEPVAFG